MWYLGMEFLVSPELQNWLLQWAVAWYWSWKILACRGSCKLGLLQLAVALVQWMEVLVCCTAINCSCGTWLVARRIKRETVEIVVSSILFDSADTAAYVSK